MTARPASTGTELHLQRAATVPPEARGLTRDGVRLMVSSPDGYIDTRFRKLPSFLDPGDLLVVNTSRTMAAAVPGTRRGVPIGVHLSMPLDDGRWVIELRRSDATGPILDAPVGESIDIPGGTVMLEEAADDGSSGGVRLWRARIDVPEGVGVLMRRHGAPIRYGYVAGAWPLSAYQTVFGERGGPFGSAEMPSAARPFTERVLEGLRARGVVVATIELHAGVSSQEAHEPPQPERFSVPERTASLVNERRWGPGRVIAVGTTVTRALESAAADDGSLAPASGWTDLVLGPERRPRVVDGLVTGWHPPEASHLDLLRAVAGRELVEGAYERAEAKGYLWHEFGDSCLLLGDRAAS